MPHCHSASWCRRLFRCVTLAAGLLLVGVHTAQAEENRISFMNDVMPVLTKAGCNIGVCHAKAGNGQNGFQLSLLGFEPLEDYESLVKAARGRRVSFASPENSLILLKGAARVPHGGGMRLDPSSPHYTVLLEWIRQGATYDGETAPTLASIEVQPSSGTMKPGSQVQLTALAHYSDGTTRDVSELALFESNEEAMATVTPTGLVTAGDIAGNVAIMVRFQGKVAVFSGSLPLGAAVTKLPETKNFIDEYVFANLKRLGIPPSEVCDDPTFIRRATLDIAGRLPTEEETSAFLASTAADKREQLVDTLLRSPEYADFFANKWSALLKNRRDRSSDMVANFAFHAWVRDSLLANKPYDQFVRELLAATGTVVTNPPVAWYKRVTDPKQQIEDVAQLFLGVRMQCAQCHHHPFERWSQDDYYSLTAFFSQVGRKPSGVRGEDLIFHQRGVATAVNVKTSQTLRPAALGDAMPDIAPDEDPRLRLANWMSSPDNPYFAKALVNRYWKHFFQRGLIEPEDDIRDTNPPSNPELLAALEKHFISSGFDLKELVRAITTSHTYQLSSVPNEHNVVDRQNFSRYYPRRMQAEVMLDSIDFLAGSQTSFANLPLGTRAIALPDNSYNRSIPFLAVFGRPEGASVCECERVSSSSLAQSLHLINASDIKGKLASATGRAAKLAKADLPNEEKVRQLYLAAFSREPREDEMQTALEFLAEPQTDPEGKPIDPQKLAHENFQDLVWALMNTKEFQFNH